MGVYRPAHDYRNRRQFVSFLSLAAEEEEPPVSGGGSTFAIAVGFGIGVGMFLVSSIGGNPTIPGANEWITPFIFMNDFE